MGLGQSHVDSHGHHHVQHSDPATTPEKFCTTLLANATCGDLMDQCFDLFKGHNTTGQVVHEPQPMWQVWTLGLFMVTIISGSAACGVLILPCLSQRVYNKVLTFFVALGVGTLSGSAVFHLLPEAFHLTETEGYMAKACMVIAGIYLFFLVDKFITIMIGCRKKNKKVVDAKAALPEAPSQDVEEAVNHTHNHNHGHSHDGDSTIGSVAWLVIFSDGLHNFIDGLGIGVAFQQDIWVGLSISIAVLCEEFPHELGDVAILISSGMNYKQALGYNLLSAATCYVGFVFGVAIGDLDPTYASFIFALAAGMFLYISLCSMLSDMNEKSEEAMKKSTRAGLMTLGLQCAGLFTGLALMYYFGVYF